MNRIRYIYFLLLGLIVSVSAFSQNEMDSAGVVLPSSAISPVLPLADSVPNASQNRFFASETDSLFSLMDSLPVTEKRDSVEEPRQIFESPISYKSVDSMAVSLENGDQIVYLYGDAYIKYNEIELTSGYIEVNLGTKEIFARGITDSIGNVTGKPHFKESSEEFDCTSLRYNFETEKGFVENVVTNQEDGKVHGAKAKMVSKDVFCMVDGKYSTCDADHPHFYLAITKGKMIGKKAIIAGRSYIVVEDFPIYAPFLPYGYIPTNKTSYSSGIIVPSYGELTGRGYYLKDGGFYWAASDYFDLKMTGEIYSKGSWGLGVASSYRLRYKFSGSFSFNYNVLVTGEKGINQTLKPSISIRWNHSQDSKANPSLTFSSNVSFASSGYNKNYEYDNAEKYLENQTNSSISLSKKFPGTPFSLSANMSVSQSTSTSTLSVTLPSMNFKVNTIQPFKPKKKVGAKKFYEDFQFSYSANIMNKISTKESEILSTPFTKWKKSVTHSLPITLPSFTLLNYINVTPSIGTNAQWYFDYVNKYWVDGYSERDGETGMQKWVKGHVETETKYGFKWNYDYNFSISGSTTLFGMYQMKNPDALVSAVRHKLDLSLGMSYHPDFTDPKRGFNKWVQIDSLGNKQLYNIFSSSSSGESGSINFSVKNNVEMKMKNLNDSTSKEKFKKVAIFDNLGFSGSYNLAADSMKLSTISLGLRTKIAGTSLNISGTLNPYALDEKGKITKYYMFQKASGLAKLGRITNLSTGFGFNFSSDQLDKKLKERQPKKPGSPAGGEMGNPENPGLQKPSEGETNDSDNPSYQKFNMPWRVNFNYSIAYTNPTGKPKINQTLSFSGSLDISQKWKASFTSGFDFNAMKLSHTTMSVTRDLHCWSMSFNFAPISKNPYYTFTLSANASMLKDLKIEKNSLKSAYY